MGLFDYIRCDYPLPDGAPTEGYQTKDTPRQYLETYTITEAGRLFGPGNEEIPFHGDIEFGTSNWSGSNGKGGYMTNDGRPYEGWAFVARFTEGRVTRITGGREDTPDWAQRLLTHEEFWT